MSEACTHFQGFADEKQWCDWRFACLATWAFWEISQEQKPERLANQLLPSFGARSESSTKTSRQELVGKAHTSLLLEICGR